MKTRDRETIQVQVDMSKPKEKELFHYYEERSKSRKWKADFLDAMRLFLSLKNGSMRILRGMYPSLGDAWDLFEGLKNKNYEAFKELFPDLYQSIRVHIWGELEAQSKSEAYQVLLQELRTMQAKIDGLKSLQTLETNPNSIKALVVAPAPMPDEDDNDLIFAVTKDKKAGFAANENFLKSMMNLQK